MSRTGTHELVRSYRVVTHRLAPGRLPGLAMGAGSPQAHRLREGLLQGSPGQGAGRVLALPWEGAPGWCSGRNNAGETVTSPRAVSRAYAKGVQRRSSHTRRLHDLTDWSSFLHRACSWALSGCLGVVHSALTLR